ncbi:hypothetical protein EON65_48840 [archaeon]|nr:MAG: hypothetical protein EON65_48840 [archaeon]
MIRIMSNLNISVPLLTKESEYDIKSNASKVYTVQNAIENIIYPTNTDHLAFFKNLCVGEGEHEPELVFKATEDYLLQLCGKIQSSPRKNQVQKPGQPIGEESISFSAPFW